MEARLEVDTAYVAFLDVLGFKGLVEQNSHKKLTRVYDNLFTANAERALSYGQFVLTTRGGEQVAVADMSKARVNMLLVSDSVMLWTDKATIASFIDVVAVVRELLVAGIYCGLPMRGGISIGPLTFRSMQLPGKTLGYHSTLFGKSLVQAYELEGKAQWSGCIVDEVCIAHHRRLCDLTPKSTASPTVEYLLDERVLSEYDVPFKENNKRRHVVVDWANANRDRPSTDVVTAAFVAHGKKITKPEDQQKVDNTIAFLDAVRPQ